MVVVQLFAVLRRNIELRRTAANDGEQGSGGGSGIRTHVTVSRKHAFQACALNHSATPPERAKPNEPGKGTQRPVRAHGPAWTAQATRSSNSDAIAGGSSGNAT
jgi:hypothetical protein